MTMVLESRFFLCCVSACVIESAKRGCNNVGPKFFVYQGVVQRGVAWFFPHIRCVQESLLVVILIGSLHLYMISPSSPLKYDGISAYLKCFSCAMKLGCVLSPSCYLSMLPFLFSFATDVVLFSEGSVFADKVADVSVFAF